jgi:hypothetical protein
MPAPRMIRGQSAGEAEAIWQPRNAAPQSESRLEVLLAKDQVSSECFTGRHVCMTFDPRSANWVKHACADLRAHPFEQRWVQLLKPLELLCGRGNKAVFWVSFYQVNLCRPTVQPSVAQHSTATAYMVVFHQRRAIYVRDWNVRHIPGRVTMTNFPQMHSLGAVFVYVHTVPLPILAGYPISKLASCWYVLWIDLVEHVHNRVCDSARLILERRVTRECRSTHEGW